MQKLTRQEILHLSLIDGIGPAAIERIARFKERGMFDQLGQIKREEFRHMGFSIPLAERLVLGLQNAAILEKELSLIERYHICWATIDDFSYPALLKHIHMPPPVLYWQGDAQIVAPTSTQTQKESMVAIIGSRKANWYGKQAIDLIVPRLVEQGYTIVSGGAFGADSMAHSATVSMGGKTVAVLGSGLLDPYPASNKPLFSQICAIGGALVSPFPLLMHASPGSFPARNRVIAGMSIGCVVVQAAAKSGALITAQFALEQGRDVFAIPGPIEDPLSAGCHALIKQGATLVTCAEDILGEYGNPLMPIKGTSPVLHEQKTVGVIGEGDRIARDNEGEKAMDPEEDSGVPDTPEGHLLHCCNSPQSLDDLAQQTGLTFSQLHEFLFELQVQGKIEQTIVGMWQRVR
jgi:DNA processing protein